MDDKKHEILNRSSEVFMSLGIKSVTMDDLAKKLGMSKKTIYKYFEDKKHLIREIMIMKNEVDVQYCTLASNSASNSVEAMLMINKFVVEQIKGIHPSVFYDLQKYHTDAWAILENHKRTFIYEQIKNNIVNGIADGVYRTNLNPDIVARIYIGNIDVLLDEKIFPPKEFRYEEVYVEIVRFQLRGLVSEKGLKILIDSLNKEANV